MENEYSHLDVYNLAECPDSKALNDITQRLLNLKDETGKNPFPFIVLDNATAMYSILTNTRDDFKPFISTIGNTYLSEEDSFLSYISTLLKVCDTLILIAHEEPGLDRLGKEDGTIHIELPERFRLEICRKADSIGHLIRSNKHCYLDFSNDSGKSIAESRVQRLSDRQFDISEKKEDGTVEVYWDRVLNNTQI